MKDTLYILGFPLNIVSGYKLYLSRGTLIKEKLYIGSKKLLGILNFSKNGFFFTFKGTISVVLDPQKPLAYRSLWHCYSTEDSLLRQQAPESLVPPELIEGDTVTEAPASTAPTTALKEPSKALIQAAQLWYVRLGYISLDFLKKTAQTIKGMPNF